MEKEIYLIQGLWNEDYHAFRSRVEGIVEYVTESYKPAGIKYTITAKAPPTLSVIPFSRKKIAAVSVYKNNTIPVHSLIIPCHTSTPCCIYKRLA